MEQLRAAFAGLCRQAPESGLDASAIGREADALFEELSDSAGSEGGGGADLAESRRAVASVSAGLQVSAAGKNAAEQAFACSSTWLLITSFLRRPFSRGGDEAFAMITVCRGTATHGVALYREQCPLPTPTLCGSAPLQAWRAEALLWALLERLPRGESVAVAGSFALHAYMRSRLVPGTDDALAWAPGDVDVYLTEPAPRKKRGRVPRKVDGGNLAVFVQHIVDFAERVEADLGVALRVRPPPEDMGGELTLGHMRAYLAWVAAEEADTGVVSVPPKGSAQRLCVEQHASLPRFGVLPKIEGYVRERAGGYCFFLIDLLLPPALASAGIDRISFIGGRDWVLDWGTNLLAPSKAAAVQAARGDGGGGPPTASAYLERVLADFDLDVCQVGMRIGDAGDAKAVPLSFTVREDVAAAIQRREMRVVKEGHIKTPSRIRKYQARGFTLCGELGAALRDREDFYDASQSGEHGRPVFQGRIEAVRAALRCAPDDAALHFWHAILHMAVGDSARCLAAIREVLRLEPAHERALMIQQRFVSRVTADQLAAVVAEDKDQ